MRENDRMKKTDPAEHEHEGHAGCETDRITERERLERFEAHLQELLAQAPASQREYRGVVLGDVLRRVLEDGFHEARPHPDRGRQFAPFAALTGFGAMAHERERVIEPRRMVTEERALALSQTLERVKSGSMVRVLHYTPHGYLETVGEASLINLPERTLRVGKTDLSLDDVHELELLS